ncbi:Uncharacterised protein [Mycobacteroides abscessus subsp. abscessus]|nr:Uncharacterised protein [Mycobacteroides abscessus subsp. abscessus]
MGSGFVGEIDGSFTRVVADELLAYRLTTRDGSIAIDSRWTLNPDPGGTLLLVDAAGFKPDDQDQMRFRQLCLVGWPTVLQRIDARKARDADTHSITRTRYGAMSLKRTCDTCTAGSDASSMRLLPRNMVTL